MRLTSALLSALLASTTCSAATLESILEPFPVPASGDYTANEWPMLNKIKGVKWKKKEGPNGPNWGETRLDKLGPAMVSAQGPRTMVFELSVSISEGQGKIFEQDQFDDVLRAQFSPDTKIRKLRGVCAEDSGRISGNAVYEVTLKDKKPIFAFVSTDAGGNSPNSRSSGFDFSVQNEARWKCSEPTPEPPKRTAAVRPTGVPVAPAAALAPQAIKAGNRLFGAWKATHCEFYVNDQLAPIQNCKLNMELGFRFSPDSFEINAQGRDPEISPAPTYQDTQNWVDVTDARGRMTRFVLIAPDKAYVASNKKDNKQTKFYLTRVSSLAQ
ncbi:MAG: hypothetical protein EKK49_17460 [Rhodocyclaceae bacterium]|nr:MAG: hypothetical protein EKK49_17460 [Rhodocyclaceae bacterium]